MKQDLVIINQDSGYLMIDIANAVVTDKQDCTLITGRLVQRDKPLASKVEFKKIIRYDRRTPLRRLLTWSVAFIQLWFSIVIHYRTSQLLIVSNPPFAPLLPLFLNNRFSLLIFDIYPNVLTESGILSNQSMLVRLWQAANRRTFCQAEHIYTITDGMKQVLRQYAGEKPIELVPVWTDNTFLKPVSKKNNPFIKKHGLTDRFVVLYSGNLGFSHNVETIIELAANIRNPNILFLIIGDGDKRRLIQKKSNATTLTTANYYHFKKLKIYHFHSHQRILRLSQ